VQVANTSVWNAFVKAAGLDVSKIKVVPVQFDPTPLTQGRSTAGSPSSPTSRTSCAQGLRRDDVPARDQGYPLVSETYFTTTSTIASKPRRHGLPEGRDRRLEGQPRRPALGATLTVNTTQGLGLTIPSRPWSRSRRTSSS